MPGRLSSICEAGFQLWKSEPKKHQLDFQIEWRQFFDRGSDPDTNILKSEGTNLVDIASARVGADVRRAQLLVTILQRLREDGEISPLQSRSSGS